MSPSAAIRRLFEAKETVRRCKEAGRLPPEEPSLFDRPSTEKRRIEEIARRSEYAEPWASYLAPYQLDVQKSL